MAEQTRSATVMLEKALSNPQTLEDLRTDPAAALKKLEAQVIQGLPPPDDKTAARLWLIVVTSFAFVLLFCVVVLGIGVFAKHDAGVTYAVKGDTILTVFTTVVGFLAGLLAPSPISKKGE